MSATGSLQHVCNFTFSSVLSSLRSAARTSAQARQWPIDCPVPEAVVWGVVAAAGLRATFWGKTARARYWLASASQLALSLSATTTLLCGLKRYVGYWDRIVGSILVYSRALHRLDWMRHRTTAEMTALSGSFPEGRHASGHTHNVCFQQGRPLGRRYPRLHLQAPRFV